MRQPGKRARSGPIIGESASRSPALAPCSQMRGPALAGAVRGA